jgi:hypothetical protein
MLVGLVRRQKEEFGIEGRIQHFFSAFRPSGAAVAPHRYPSRRSLRVIPVVPYTDTQLQSWGNEKRLFLDSPKSFAPRLQMPSQY